MIKEAWAKVRTKAEGELKKMVHNVAPAVREEAHKFSEMTKDDILKIVVYTGGTIAVGYAIFCVYSTGSNSSRPIINKTIPAAARIYYNCSFEVNNTYNYFKEAVK